MKQITAEAINKAADEYSCGYFDANNVFMAFTNGAKWAMEEYRSLPAVDVRAVAEKAWEAGYKRAYFEYSDDDYTPEEMNKAEYLSTLPPSPEDRNKSQPITDPITKELIDRR